MISGKRRGGEVLHLAFVHAAEVSRRALFPDPGVDILLPARAVGADLPHHVEILRIEFEDVGFDHQLFRRVEVLEIEDPVIVNDPLPLRMQISLDRAAFDLIQDRVLNLVGLRDARNNRTRTAPRSAAPLISSTGRPSRRTLMPQALNAVTSLFFVITPKVARIETSTRDGQRVVNQSRRQKQVIT